MPDAAGDLERAKTPGRIPFDQVELTDLRMTDPSTSLVIIGNGFDIMHGVRSSYRDFEKTIGRRSPLRFYMETYLDVGDIWANLEESLGRLNYSMFLNPEVIDMWLDDFGAYDPDAQAADIFGAIETAISPTFEIPMELNRRFKGWLKTLKVGSDERPLAMLHGDYRVLSFNYTEFVEDLYGAKRENVCYIHGCRRTPKGCKPDEIVLGHRPGTEEEQWDKVELEPFDFKDPYKRSVMDMALETATWDTSWYDDATTKHCGEIIEAHRPFFDGLSDVEEVFVVGHSLSEVDYPYFEEVRSKCDAQWFIGYHSDDDLERLKKFVACMRLDRPIVFRT